jgi:putative membrane protein insertion efficiency factor
MTVSAVSYASSFLKPVSPAFSHVSIIKHNEPDTATKKLAPERIMYDAYKATDDNLSLPQRLCLKMILFYQKMTHYRDANGHVSNRLGAKCPFYPHCSLYTADAIREHGVIKGIWLGFWRIMRCNPFTISWELKKQGKPLNHWFKMGMAGRLDELRGSVSDPVPAKRI